jgi:D-alanine-D-alanine ligase
MTSTGEGRRLRALVVMGGPDAERAVSLESGGQVAKALRADPTIEVVERVVDRPTQEELAALVDRERIDVVVPVLHGPFGEGGPLQELLEALVASHGIGYVGSAPRAAAIAMDKPATKRAAIAAGVRTPRSCDVSPESDAAMLAAFDDARLGLPVVVKPANEGSSVGLSICSTRADVGRACSTLAAMGKRILVEEYIKGREITVGIVHGEPLPIIEIVPAVAFYDYEAKYHRDDTRYLLDPSLPAGIADEVRRATKAVWNALGCRDLARADYLVDDRGAWFLEINTMPGMTTHSLVPKAAAHTGVSMPKLCGDLVRAAAARRPAAIAR